MYYKHLKAMQKVLASNTVYVKKKNAQGEKPL